jgi:uncharacterized protein (DUF433 family)
MQPQPKRKHPYIVATPDTCGGSPRIEGTRFPVRSVVVYVLRQGMTPEELVQTWDHLSLAAIYDALSYYYDFQEEIERDIEENTEEYWQQRLGPNWNSSASTSTKT